MAIHYSQTADASAKMQGMMAALDPLGTKARTKVSNSAEKCLTQILIFDVSD
jgi:hypothetical protein